jgi:CBS domain-containing protein
LERSRRGRVGLSNWSKKGSPQRDAPASRSRARNRAAVGALTSNDGNKEETEMLIKEVMHPDCHYCNADENIVAAARIMAKEGVGSVPVAKDEKLVGMLTDRDIVVRGLAVYDEFANLKANEVMSDQVYYCFEDQECSEVASNMADVQVRRMPVVTRDDKRLVGVVSLGDFARSGETPAAADALEGVSQN